MLLVMPRPLMPLLLRYTSVVSLSGLLFVLNSCRHYLEKFKEIWYNSRNHIRRFSGKRKDIKSLQYLMGHKESEPVEPYTKRPQKYGDLRRFS